MIKKPPSCVILKWKFNFKKRETLDNNTRTP